MMTLNGKMSHHDKPVPAHVAAIVEAKRLLLAERVAAQETDAQMQAVFCPVSVPATKRQIRRRNYGKRVAA